MKILVYLLYYPLPRCLLKWVKRKYPGILSLQSQNTHSNVLKFYFKKIVNGIHAFQEILATSFTILRFERGNLSRYSNYCFANLENSPQDIICSLKVRTTSHSTINEIVSDVFHFNDHICGVHPSRPNS